MAVERTEAQEWNLLRSCRCLGVFPNSKKLTGRRKELALAYDALSDQIDQIRAKIDELDSEVFSHTKECDCRSEED